jgi:hypothetical protein
MPSRSGILFQKHVTKLKYSCAWELGVLGGGVGWGDLEECECRQDGGISVWHLATTSLVEVSHANAQQCEDLVWVHVVRRHVLHQGVSVGTLPHRNCFHTSGSLILDPVLVHHTSNG